MNSGMNSPSPAVDPISPFLPLLDPPSPLPQPISLSPSPSVEEEPSVFLTEPANEQSALEPGKRRGRKEHSREQKQQAHLRRTEHNRRYARENRERKKQHIVQLEWKVQALTMELSACRRRLAEYESAAAAGSGGIQELCQHIRRETQKLAGRLILQVADKLQATPYNAESTLPVLMETAGERTSAIDAMAQAMINLSVTLPCRYMISVAEEMDRRSSKRKRSSQDPLDVGTWSNDADGQGRARAETLLGAMPEARKLLRESAGKMRRSAGQIMGALENIKREMMNVDLFMIEKMAPRYDVEYVHRVISWTRVYMGEAQAQARHEGRVVVPVTGATAMPVGSRENEEKNYC